MDLASILALCSAVLWSARMVLFIALHVVRSDYSPVAHAVSDYAVGSTRRLATAMTWITAAAWAALAAAVLLGLPDWADRVGITIALAVLTALFLLLPFVPTTLEGEKQTVVGRVHMLVAIAWFAISYACMGNFVRLFERTGPEPLSTALAAVMWIALVGLVALIVSLVVPGLRRRTFGISERVFIVCVTLFYLLTGVALAGTA